jgi:hypothetical protein
LNTVYKINENEMNGYANNRNYKNELEIAKVYLPILYVIFRLQYGINKYYLMFHVFSINMYIQYRNRNRIDMNL